MALLDRSASSLTLFVHTAKILSCISNTDSNEKASESEVTDGEVNESENGKKTSVWGLVSGGM